MFLTQALNDLVQIHEARGNPIHTYLYPGLSRGEIDSITESLGLKLPETFYELYQWHNGINIDRAGDLLFGEYDMLPLEESITEYQRIVNAYEDNSLHIKNCLPIASLDASIIAVYCDSEPLHALQYPIIGLFHSTSILFEDIETMIRTVNTWYTNGVYDTFPINESLRKAIWQQLNPGVI